MLAAITKMSLKAFEQAVKTHPESAAAANNLANVQLKLGQHEAALTNAKKALQLAAEDAASQAQINDTMDDIRQARSAKRK